MLPLSLDLHLIFDSEATLSPDTSSAYSSLPPSPSTWDDSVSNPTLRLLRSLGHGAFSAVWLAEDLSPVPLTLVSKKSVRDLRRRVSGRDKEREKGKEREQEEQIEKVKAINGASLETDSPRRLPRNLRQGLKSILSFSRLPKLAVSSGPVDDPLSEPPDSPWVSLPSSASLHPQNMDMGSSSLSRASSIHSYRSYSSFSTGGISRHSSLKLPSPDGDSVSLSRDSSLKNFRDRVRGTRPAFRLGRAYLDERHGEMGWKEGVGEDREGEQKGQTHLGANPSRQSSLRGGTNSRLVAVKMTPKKVIGAKGRRERAEEERTRVGFVREVEVLKVS